MVMTKATKLGIPFNRPYLTGRELSYIAEAHMNGQLAGDGEFTKRCQKWLEDLGDTRKALLTHSCTAALEMAAILCAISPGDEVIMPSYTFVSTANARSVMRSGWGQAFCLSATSSATRLRLVWRLWRGTAAMFTLWRFTLLRRFWQPAATTRP